MKFGQFGLRCLSFRIPTFSGLLGEKFTGDEDTDAASPAGPTTCYHFYLQSFGQWISCAQLRKNGTRTLEVAERTWSRPTLHLRLCSSVQGRPAVHRRSSPTQR